MEKESIKPIHVFAWILALASLAVGVRNFEEGLTIDAPLYATIARNIARGGSWFRMSANIPTFMPFAEHPHLSFWIQAVILKFLPAQDWAIRTQGHLWFVAFLTLFFFYIRSKSQSASPERVAILSVLLLTFSHFFSNTFSSFYLDPGLLTLGTGSWILFEQAVETQHSTRSLLIGISSGVFLALATLCKGLMVVGFLPLFAWFFIVGCRKWGIKKSVRLLLAVTGAIAIVFWGYWLLIARSDCPEFFAVYWQRVGARLEQRASLAKVFRWEFWDYLLKHSNYCLLLAITSIPWVKKQPVLVTPWILIATFVVQISSAGFTGGQYMILILPWIMWLSAEVLCRLLPWIQRGSNLSWIRVTGFVYLMIVVLLQYFPIRIHGTKPKEEFLALRQVTALGTVKRFYYDYERFNLPGDAFVEAAAWAWFSDVLVEYPSRELPFASTDASYFQYGKSLRISEQLKSKNWCPNYENTSGILWLACPFRS